MQLRAETPTPTPQAPPQGLTDAQLLELAAREIEPYDRIPPGEYEAEYQRALEVYGSELIAAMRAAIAADRAARPAPAPVPTFLDAIRLANGCHDYSGGYMCEAAEVYHAGITTVVNALRKAAIGPWDSQTNAVFAMGSACLNTPAPTPDEVEARFRAWWGECYPNVPAGRHTVRSHVAFALHLLGGEVAA